MKQDVKSLLKSKLEKEGEMSPEKKEIKLRAVSDLKELAKELMKSDMDSRLAGYKKVTVAAPDKEGLKAGLEKAEELVGAEEAEEHEEGEACEACSKAPCECEGDEEADLEAKIKELQEKLAAKRK